MNKKLISVVSPCYNEVENVAEAYSRVKSLFDKNDYRYEHIFIDNNSNDGTVEVLKDIARKDKNIKIILNAKNFGHIRSPYYGLLQSSGDAAILMASDLQDPPEVIPKFIKKWESGSSIVVGVKTKSEENILMTAVRNLYYRLIKKVSETEQINNFTGFGLYSKQFIEILREIKDPYPYFRGLVSELGTDIARVEFTQPTRKRGKTKNNLYTLYDMAMLGFVNHSKMPIRIASMIGFYVSMLSLLAALIYLVLKIAFWERFSLGLAPMVIGLFFFSSVQLFFIGVIGEYIGAIYTQVRNRPLVIEKERINF